MTLKPQWTAQWIAQWRAMARREQGLLLAALALVLGALLWWVALSPALSILRTAERQHQVLDAQWQQMQRLKVQASAIQAQPRLASEDARRQLDAAVKSLGDQAQLAVVGGRATVTLRGVSAEKFSQWLEQIRVNARAVASEAHLVRNAAGQWEGTLVLTLASTD